ncbi:AfsR/SARP family transcriptional regulator [Streptomyces odontomachi]|uniref:AfsR/SARP family transcriptional regulator n=1 Tax=Streptomyces odontomachi TaxID=2944940 RepID=UPI00210D1414|nr:AfsR/SARP family transcriptional regulator [Streptomyces sp. ODS25]
MKYEVLGRLRVSADNGSAHIGAPKVEMLLAILLIRANRIVTADQLMMEIWGERLPRRATATLYVYVSELRKFLNRAGAEQSPIVTRSPGYMLTLEDGGLDYQVFLDLTEQGRALMREHRHEEAVARFQQGLALWRGPVLGDIGHGPILSAFTTWLTEVRMDCTEMLVEARLQLGLHRELVGPLYSLTAESPLRETFYRQLMLALYRSDRRADALKVYQAARSTLINELGLEPCSALRELHQAILLADDRVLCAAG